MLRAATFLKSRGLLTRLANRGTYVPTTAQHPKIIRPIKGMSTDCEEVEPPPFCPPQPSLMDYGPDHIGCWQKNYDEKNKKANRDLMLGIVSVIFALLIINRNGMVKGYYSPLFFPHYW